MDMNKILQEGLQNKETPSPQLIQQLKQNHPIPQVAQITKPGFSWSTGTLVAAGVLLVITSISVYAAIAHIRRPFLEEVDYRQANAIASVSAFLTEQGLDPSQFSFETTLGMHLRAGSTVVQTDNDFYWQAASRDIRERLSWQIDVFDDQQFPLTTFYVDNITYQLLSEHEIPVVWRETISVNHTDIPLVEIWYNTRQQGLLNDVPLDTDYHLSRSQAGKLIATELVNQFGLDLTTVVLIDMSFGLAPVHHEYRWWAQVFMETPFPPNMPPDGLRFTTQHNYAVTFDVVINAATGDIIWAHEFVHDLNQWGGFPDPAFLVREMPLRRPDFVFGLITEMPLR